MNNMKPEAQQPVECYHCKHSFEAGQQLECRRYPPTVTLGIIPPQVMGGEPRMTKHSAFPNCNHKCGEFSLQTRSKSGFAGFN